MSACVTMSDEVGADAAATGGSDIALQLRQAAMASDVAGAMALIRTFVADERLGCAEKAECLAGGHDCAAGLQCLMAPQAFSRLKSELEDLCDELLRPSEIRLQRQLRHLVDVAPAMRAG
jgi:hypothetical protein